MASFLLVIWAVIWTVGGAILHNFPRATYDRWGQAPYVEDPTLTERGVRRRRRTGLAVAVVGLLTLASLLRLTTEIPTLNFVVGLAGITATVLPGVVGRPLERFRVPTPKPVIAVLGALVGFAGLFVL